eukprot:99819_1
MVEVFVSGYIRIMTQSLIPLDVIKIISSYAQGKDGTLIVSQNKTIILDHLNQEYKYEFTNVVIKSGGTLTVHAWNPCSNKGGKLLITAMISFVIEKGGMINLDAIGYEGGKSCQTGESYMSPQRSQGEHNIGGGGGGGYTCYGGGYGTPGNTNSYHGRRYDNGGIVYGNKELSVLHLGSGGGDSGGNGGGALKIECVKFKNNGMISCNGGNVDYYASGCGSGGSIMIVCEEFIMDSDDTINCYIRACGGKNTGIGNRTEHGGEGGDGRIRIKSSNNLWIKQCVESEQIMPQPYIG